MTNNNIILTYVVCYSVYFHIFTLKDSVSHLDIPILQIVTQILSTC